MKINNLEKISFLAVILLVSPHIFAAEYFSRFTPAADVTLEQAIRLGIENNTNLLSVEQSIIIAEHRVNETSFMRFPQFDLMASATKYDLEYPTVLPESMGFKVLSPQSGRNDNLYGVRVSAVQYLYSGGRISGSIKLAKAQLKEEKSKYETERNNVIFNVKNSFYNMLYAQKRLETAEEGFKRAQNYAKKQPLQGWRGVAVTAAVEKFRTEVFAARHEFKKAHLDLLKNLNKELNAEVKIKGDFKPFTFESDLSKLTLWAMQFRPELKTALYELEVYSIYTNLSISQKYPDIIVGASFEQLGDSSLEDTNKQISMAVRLPLSYGFISQPRQRKAQQKQSTLRRADLEDRIRIQVSENFSNLTFWQAEVVQREASLEILSKEIAKNEKLGSFGQESLLALEAYQTAKYSYLQAVFENLKSKAGLEWAVGQDL
ncbi:Outer membrane efflux protein [Elusimicrobium minutum Pei191]|uniref:Outer membrane efflux protein n=1 Tax=Elusimicrobium minutum (strain Pei191) TaxID=445932 RepID=B2KBV8_ELUMP|nr:TolC family protein [Elusimicrobium minutum]ACC97862.1 Outer membrane efflux protein [Elusimicrobium minutum Pei191]